MPTTAGTAGPVMWFSDVTYLWEVFAKAAGGDERVEPTADGGYLITDASLYEAALENLAERAKREGAQAALVLLEFSRRNYVQALKALAEQGVQPDLVVYLDVPLETALHRNRQRAVGGGHYVSEREMQTTFASDDLDDLKAVLGGRLLVLDEPDEQVDAVNNRVFQIFERLKEE
jgi:adenylate kinase family enzyme